MSDVCALSDLSFKSGERERIGEGKRIGEEITVTFVSRCSRVESKSISIAGRNLMHLPFVDTLGTDEKREGGRKEGKIREGEKRGG